MSQWTPFFRKRPADAQLDSELRYHIERLTEDKMAAGLTPEQARREALIEFGGREQVKEEMRDMHRIFSVENTVANMKSGLRAIRKSPSFSIAVILTLALGIGANSMVFSAINAVLLRPLPFPNAAELVLVGQYNRKAKSPNSLVAPARLEDWNRLNRTFQAVFGWTAQDASETSGRLPEKVTQAMVSPRFLQVWGISPALGRDFSPQEEHFGGPAAILISDRFWRRRFHAEQTAIGKQLRLENRSYTIVGVMPASFLFPDHEVEAWCPSPADAPWSQNRDYTWYTVIGRLRQNVTLAQAQADLANVQVQLGRQYPKSDAKLGVHIEPLKENVVGGVRHSLWLLFGSVSLLLLIACTNVAALMLARTTERRREISVRFALGGSRMSVIVQLLTECFVLALAGAGLGLLLAVGGFKGLRAFAQGLPRAEEITLDWRILLYTLGCAVLATFVCGLIPALRSTRRSTAMELSHSSRTQVSSRNPLQWLLVGVQVALAVTLLIGAGLLIRSYEKLGRVSPGFDFSNVLTFRISGNWGETADFKTLSQRINRTLDELRALPSVRSAATSAILPGIPGDNQLEIRVAEGRAEPEEKIIAEARFVSHGYFDTMRIPLLTGESCRPSLRTDSAVVNRSFVNKYFGGSTAIGHHLQLISNSFVPPAEIKGIVADAREQGLNREPGPTVYWCVSAPDPSPWFLIRTQANPMSIAKTLRERIHQVEPARSVFDISPLDQHLSESFAENRLRTLLLMLFAFTAILLACVGLYGTLSYFVTLRKREIGLRLALGALRAQIVMQFLSQGLGVSLLGCVAGTLLAAACSRILTGLLYGVSTTDAVTWLSVALLVFTVTGAASLVPAFRAARLEPMQVLRDE